MHIYTLAQFEYSQRKQKQSKPYTDKGDTTMTFRVEQQTSSVRKTEMESIPILPSDEPDSKCHIAAFSLLLSFILRLFRAKNK